MVLQRIYCLLLIVSHHILSQMQQPEVKVEHFTSSNCQCNHSYSYLPCPPFYLFKRNILLLDSLKFVFTLMADFAVVKTLYQVVFLCSSFIDLRTSQWMLTISDTAEIIHNDCWFNRQMASATDVCKRLEKQQSVPSIATLAISVQV